MILTISIMMGREDATREEVIEAAKKAACHDFIMTLPDKYDTIVGEGGSTLAGGEKQRISIARALLKDGDRVLMACYNDTRYRILHIYYRKRKRQDYICVVIVVQVWRTESPRR